jgi:hypothetical protein
MVGYSEECCSNCVFLVRLRLLTEKSAFVNIVKFNLLTLTRCNEHIYQSCSHLLMIYAHLLQSIINCSFLTIWCKNISLEGTVRIVNPVVRIVNPVVTMLRQLVLTSDRSFSRALTISLL